MSESPSQLTWTDFNGCSYANEGYRAIKRKTTRSWRAYILTKASTLPHVAFERITQISYPDRETAKAACQLHAQNRMNEQPTEQPGAADALNVTVCDGKYTVIQDATGRLCALRYGEEWRDCCGDNLIYSLAAEVERLRAENERMEDVNAGLIEAGEEVLSNSVDIRGYSDGPCLDRHVRDALRAAIARAAVLAESRKEEATDGPGNPTS